ncbi:hypothetical protein Bbelb_017280 [Branchiostoma belcheri]|nr:hypothetical protein Bbelb_017280 [Branchiostoma belcheri]
MAVCVILSVLTLAALFDCSPAARDNKGTEFIVTFLENVDRQRYNPKVFIACPHPSGATVDINLPATGENIIQNVAHGQVTKVELDRTAVELTGSGKSYRAVHITSDVEIVVYGVFAEKASSDAYLALPTDVLGTEYFVPCATMEENARSYPVEFGVVGIHDGTTVTIVPSQAVTFDGQNYAAGQEFSVRLDRFETLQKGTKEQRVKGCLKALQPSLNRDGGRYRLQTTFDPLLTSHVGKITCPQHLGQISRNFLVQKTEDLTGSKITATHPVAVLSGNMFAICRPVGVLQDGSGDHIVEMIPPVDTWRKEFVTVPLTKRTAGYLFRVVAARDNTQRSYAVSTYNSPLAQRTMHATAHGQTWRADHTLTPCATVRVTCVDATPSPRFQKNVDITNENTRTLNAGEFWEIDVPSDEYRHVTSSEPVLLVQYTKTNSVDNSETDPFMMVIPPVAQFDAEYTFSKVELMIKPGAITHHINLVTRSADKAGLLLDGQRLPSDTVWHDVPGTDYAGAQLNISAGTHTIGHISPIVTTGLFSYGFVKLESYGYPGGLRLARIAASCSATAPVPGDRQDNDCDGRVDEELLNGRDDDGDGLVDEDLAIGNCAENREQYRSCLVQRCRNLVP